MSNSISLKAVRSAANAFTGLVIAYMADTGGLTAAMVKGLRNLYRSAIRDGGTKHEGFYSLLPVSASKEDGGAAATPVSAAIVELIKANVIGNTAALIPLLIKAGTVRGKYNENNDAKPPISVEHAVDVDCTKIKAPSAKELKAYVEQAFAGGGSSVIEGF